MENAPAETVEVVHRRWIRRHSLLVRITHWITALCLVLLLMSGLQIFNAHPALYWGKQSDFSNPSLALTAEGGANGTARGATIVFGRSFDTTGVLGLSTDAAGEEVQRGFPSWSTVPGSQDLATGRRWHFFFAWLLVLNGLVYLAHGLLSRHIWRDLLPSRDQLRHIGGSVWDHVRFRHPEGEEAKRYNVLQQLSYLAVIFLLLPTIALTGMTMSPGLDTAVPQLLTLFGGRQSARMIHFIAAFALVLFVVVHVFEVLISGVWNNLRSMITGRYVIARTSETHAE